MSWICSILDCGRLSFTLHDHIVHLRNEHSGMTTTCPVDGCISQFTKSDTLRKHVSRKHPNLRLRIRSIGEHLTTPDVPSHEADNCRNETAPAVGADTTEADDCRNDTGPAVDADTTVDTVGNPLSDASAAAAFILRLKERHNLTQVATNGIIKDVLALLDSEYGVLRNSLQNLLSNHEDVGHSTAKSIVSEFTRPSMGVTYHLQQMQSSFKQQQYYTKHFDLLTPSPILLGKSVSLVGKAGMRKPIEVPHYMYHTSIQQTLTILFKNHNFCKLLKHPHERSKGDVLKDFCDGQNAGSSAVPNTIDIVLYYDDVEVCNPIGSKSGTHKLGLFYFTVLNIPPIYRSRLQCIFLLAVTRSKDLRKYGIDSVFRLLIQELNEFSEEGFTFVVMGNQERWKCRLVAIVADTLAAHQIAGFKEGVGFANQKCRTCMCTFTDMNSKFSEEQFVLRDLNTHISIHCANLTDTSVASGVNRRAAVLDIKRFNIFDSMPHDLMHILLEGCLPYTLKLLLNHYLGKKSVNLQQINESILNFEYSYLDVRNMPSVITQNHLSPKGSLRQSASQMWLLCRLMPFFLHGCLDFTDPVWQCYVLLLSITTTLMSTSIDTEEVSGLRFQIEAYLHMFRKSFPDNNIIPKQHYLLHLPTSILKMGPVVQFWAMRFEAKHSFFKRLGQISGYKNVAKYMAERHQRHLCMELLNGGMDTCFLCDKMSIGPSRELERREMTSLAQELLVSIPEIVLHGVKKCKWVTLNGNTYKPGCFVVIEEHENLPVFGSVKMILVSSDKVYLHLQVYENLGVDENTNSYILKAHSGISTIVKLQCLWYHEPQSAYRVSGELRMPIKVLVHHRVHCQ